MQISVWGSDNVTATAMTQSKGQLDKIRAPINPITPNINWNNIIGQLTADHWGVNDMKAGTTSVNHKMATFYEQIKPGVIRIHHAGLVNEWVNNEAQSWNLDKIRSVFENSKNTYKHSGRVMLTLDACPTFISSSLPLTEQQEDHLAVFFAQLPVIIKNMGYYVEMYEFLNEKEKAYSNNHTAYWRMLNKIAVAIKTADPSVKCGGPAVSWPHDAIYRGFIDNCAENMDFISFHLYARGHPGDTPYPDDDLFIGQHPYRNQAKAAGNVVKYLVEKNITHLETFLDEFNVQYVWKPYEPAHHNYIGASWMACFIKSVALEGVTGLNVWNTQDGAYGLNYNSAPANLYLLNRKYLRGDIAESTDLSDRVEMIPIINENGGKSILFINRMGDETTILAAKQLIGGDFSIIKAMRLDETTEVSSKVYMTETIDVVPTDIILNPYGMVLLTNVADDAVTARIK